MMMPQTTASERSPVRFFWQAELDEKASTEQGRPVYRDNPFIEKWTPGDSTVIIRRPVRPLDKEQHPREWAAFEARQEQHGEGTPLKELGFLTEAQRLEFAAARVNTAEDLVSMPDNVAQRFPGIHAIKRKAQAYLDAAAGNAPLLKMQAELEQRDGELAILRQRLAAIEEEMAVKKTTPAKK